MSPKFFYKNDYSKAFEIDFQPTITCSTLTFIKNNPQFSYGDVNFEKFSKQYKGKGWLGRKIIALPAAIAFGSVMIVYHLAQMCLGAIKALRAQDSRYFKAPLYCVFRDIQESFGWLITLFNDKLGQYQVQESRLHKGCYNYFASDEIPPINNGKTLTEIYTEAHTAMSCRYNDEISQKKYLLFHETFYNESGKTLKQCEDFLKWPFHSKEDKTVINTWIEPIRTAYQNALCLERIANPETCYRLIHGDSGKLYETYIEAAKKVRPIVE